MPKTMTRDVKANDEGEWQAPETGTSFFRGCLLSLLLSAALWGAVYLTSRWLMGALR